VLFWSVSVLFRVCFGILHVLCRIPLQFSGILRVRFQYFRVQQLVSVLELHIGFSLTHCFCIFLHAQHAERDIVLPIPLAERWFVNE